MTGKTRTSAINVRSLNLYWLYHFPEKRFSDFDFIWFTKGMNGFNFRMERTCGMDYKIKEGKDMGDEFLIFLFNQIQIAWCT